MGDLEIDAPKDEPKPTRIEIAKQDGLTMYDFVKMHQDLIKGTDTIDGQTYFDRAREFLSKYGVDLVLGTDDQQYSAGGKPFPKEELDQKVVK
jgi:hypothetical protein